MRLSISLALLGMLSAAATSGSMRSALADDAPAFYRSKTLEIRVGTGPGGGYDAAARLVAAFLGKFIPGDPKVIVTNVPGGGGIQDANELYNAAPQDGSVMGTFSNAMITEPLLGAGPVKFQPAKFTWIGSTSHEDGICVAGKGSGVRNWADLLSKSLIVGTTAPGTTTYMYPAMLKNVFGAKFKLVSGYPDAGQIALALERGEIQAVCQAYSSLKTQHGNWFRDGVVQPIVALGSTRNPDFPNLPSVMEFARDEATRQVLKVVFAPTAAGRPFAAPPAVPADRARALRHAFDLMVADADFLNAARKRGMEIRSISGLQISSLVQEIYDVPQEAIARTKQAVNDEASPP